MTEYLNIIIDLILIWAVDRTRRELFLSASAHRLKVNNYLNEILLKPFRIPELKALNGKMDKLYVASKISEKFAERAFTMASTANLGVIALQKALQTPKFLTKVQSQRNQLAKNEVDKLFTTEGEFDYLRSILPQEEIDVLDAIERQKMKDANSNGAQ
jgi:hypothetical protein